MASMRDVFLHGFAGDPRDWAPVLEHLEGEAVTLRLPGHGSRSDPEPPPADFDQAVDRLWRRLPPGPIRLCGYSLGGRLALGLAARDLEADDRRVHALVLVGAGLGVDEPAARSQRRALDRDRARALERDPARFFRDWDALPLLRPRGRSNQVVARLEAHRRRRAQLDPTRLARTLEALSPGGMPSYRRLLVDLPYPLALVAGAHDPTYAAAYREAAREAGRADALTLWMAPDAGHRVLLDAPDALGGFLRGWRDRAASAGAPANDQ